MKLQANAIDRVSPSLLKREKKEHKQKKEKL